MRVYKRGQYWWCSYADGGTTVRKSTRCTTRKAAEITAARWERERADPALAAARKATLRAEAERYISECELAGKHPGTLGMYRQKAANLLAVLGDNTPLADLDTDMVDNYFRLRRDEGAADGTLQKEWITLRQILSSAAHRNRFAGDPRRLKPLWLSAAYKPRKRYLPWEELQRLLAVLEPVHRTAVQVMVATGMRRAEFRAARREDFDLIAWRVAIRGTKTEGARREIPVPSPFRLMLRDALESTPMPANGGPLFAPWGNANRDLARACTRAGIPRVTLNDLRRTFASLLRQSGAPNEVIAKLMGHASTAMVDRVYGKHTTDSLADQLERTVRPMYESPSESTPSRPTQPEGNLARCAETESRERLKSPQLYQLSYQPSLRISAGTTADVRGVYDPCAAPATVFVGAEALKNIARGPDHHAKVLTAQQMTRMLGMRLPACRKALEGKPCPPATS